MTKQDIKDRINLFFPDIMCAHMEDIDENRPLWEQQIIDELDILELLAAIDEEFGTHLYGNRGINLLRVSLEDIVTLVEQELNR